MRVDLIHRDETAVVTLNRPDALNALNAEIIDEIGATIDSVAASDARAVIFTGAGEKAFCAGADIKELLGASMTEARQRATAGQRVFAKLDTLPILSIALINGYAFGGGLELAMACTFRLATPNARMGLPEIKLGAIPGYGGTQRLPRLIGTARALELIMSGRTVEPEEALSIGLINSIVEDEPLEAAIAFARSFTGFSLPILALAREAVMRANDAPLDEGLKIEADLNTLAFQTKDVVEGMNAFIEKRKARFRDE